MPLARARGVRATLALAASLGLVLVLAGCGGKDTEAPSGDSSLATELPLPPPARQSATAGDEGAPGAPATVTPETQYEEVLETSLRLMQQRQFHEAIRLLSVATKLRPDDARALRLLGNAYASLNNPPRALRLLQESARIEPDNPGIHYEIAQVAVNMGNLDLADRSARRTLELDPDSPKGQDMLATVLHHRRDYAGLLALLEPVVARDPGRVQARYLVGLAYFGQDRLPEARDTLQEVVRRQPAHAAAHRDLAGVLARLGDEEGAAQERAAFKRLTSGN